MLKLSKAFSQATKGGYYAHVIYGSHMTDIALSLPQVSLVPSPLPAAILSRARKMVWETEPTFLVRDVMSRDTV